MPTTRTLFLLLLAGALCLPVLGIAAFWLQWDAASAQILREMAATVLPGYLGTTLALALLAGAGVIAVGVPAALLVTAFDFPGRRSFEWLLLLPLAMPAYVTAYAYTDFLQFSGPLQTWLRAGFGLEGRLLPEVRSLWGAVWVFSFTLYPYVYLSARASFVQQSVCALEVARTLGRTPLATLWAVALPLARPALAAGLALVLMECLNDLGAVQYLGVQTLSQSIYATWLQRSNLGGAAQLATVMLVLIVLMLSAERWARGGAKVHHTTGRYRSIPFEDLTGWRGLLAGFLAVLPFVIGFVLPFLQLARHAVVYAGAGLERGFFQAAGNSLMLAAISSFVAVALALVVGYSRRIDPNRLTQLAARASGLGYAIPGTVLAPRFSTPSEAKTYIAGLDFFMGARMHACIAAFSSGVANTIWISLEPRLRRISARLPACNMGLCT